MEHRDVDRGKKQTGTRMKKTTHGGARKGAGRPRKADSRQLVNFTLSRETVALLREKIPARGRSMFVEVAITEAFKST